MPKNIDGKLSVDANELYDFSVDLADRILADNFRPDFLIALWRGGTPPGIAVHEIFKYLGIETDHIAVRTDGYGDDNKLKKKIKVYGLNYLFDNAGPNNRLLIIDDVWDTGSTIENVLKRIHHKMGDQAPHDIKVATIYFKPEENLTDMKPDYYCEETDKWVVFPHELMKLKEPQIKEKHAGVASLLRKYGAFD
ncbi:hypoxanthine phosphoribosyltransferase [Candidatus Woesearchaeota archaeon]|nr:hypoxanthine phosphoribosyltransferase [Candidatus Woesearchaeota archaeon]